MKTEVIVDLQIESTASELPTGEQLQTWTEAALRDHQGPAELTLRLVDSEESQQLNHVYRGKDKPTNVLSFPADLPPDIDVPLLGDIIVCAPVVYTEAKQQTKPLMAHWAHMVVHGCLHLLGHDHINDSDAEKMENLEVEILAGMGFANPYQEEEP